MGQSNSAPAASSTAATSAVSSPSSASASDNTNKKQAQQSQKQKQQQQHQQGEVIAPTDRSQLGVIKSQKVNREVLKWVGDSEVLKKSDAEIQAAKLEAMKKEKKCRPCCMLVGGMLTMVFSGCVAGCATMFMAFRERHRLPIGAMAMARHAVWMTLPPTAVGASLHFFLADALWSNRRNGFGAAWLKALAVNTAVWVFMISTSTLFWRHGLRRLCGKWGNQLYYRYPIPTTNLETRLLEDPNAVFSGMGWSYWALGLVSGQLGYLTATGAFVYTNRPYYFMSPQGPYAKSCAPLWRREALAKLAGMELPPESY